MKYDRITITENGDTLKVAGFNNALDEIAPVIKETVDELRINNARVRVNDEVMVTRTATATLGIEIYDTADDLVANIVTDE